MEQKVNCIRANEIDLVEYLFILGYKPVKIRGADFWYFSPMRNEKTASFKVNRIKNCWFDHGSAIGGTMVDFGIRYFECSVSAFLERLNIGDFSFQKQPQPTADFSFIVSPLKLLVTGVYPLSSPALFHYLSKRGIDLTIPVKYCVQVNFNLSDQKYFGIGFRNNAGGYEIRNEAYKYASAPKDITHIINGAERVCVFEGFMDFLSYLTIQGGEQENDADYMVLNGIGLFQRASGLLKCYPYISLFLDKDNAGREATRLALSSSKAYRDESSLYSGFKDLNHWLMKA